MCKATIRPSPSSGAEDVVDDGQRARVAALDGAWLPALWALQPLPGPARPQRPAPPGRDPQSPSCTFSYQSWRCWSSTAGDSSIDFCWTSDGLKLLRVPVAESVGRAGAHRSMRLRQPSQKAWPHTRMRGTTPSLRRTASQSVRPQEGCAIQKPTTWTWRM